MKIKKVDTIATLLLGVSIFLVVKYSEADLLVDIAITRVLFLHDCRYETAVLSLTTGYLSGYIVYYLTSYLPAKNKSNLYMKNACQELSAAFGKLIYIFLLIGKSAARPADWEKIDKLSNDRDALGTEYFDIVKNFDILGNASTMLRHKESEEKLKWYEYIYEILNDSYETIERIITNYNIYLDDNISNKIFEWKKEAFVSMIIGANTGDMFWHTIEGENYLEAIPAPVFYAAMPKTMTPIFYTDLNRNMYKSFVDLTLEIYELACEYEKPCSSYIEKIRKHNIGVVGSSRIEVKVQNV